MTDDLIARLAGDLKPVRAHELTRRLGLAVALGFTISVPMMAMSLGFRPDLREAAGAAMFWVKSGYTLILGLAGLWAVAQVGRPGLRGEMPLSTGLGVAVVIAAASALAYALAPAEARHDMVMGSSALVCPALIVVLSIPFLVAGLAFMRGAAPTHPTLAGASAGLMAGGLGAWVYSFHCIESGLPFLALWYSLGIAAVMAAGALLGRPLLRW